MAQVLKEEVQKRIVDAALEVFAEKGYLAATMGEIATRAGVSTGNIYRYYDSKEALFEVVLDDAFVARFRALLQERVTSLTRRASAALPEDGYQLASEALLRFSIDNRLRMIILLGRAGGTRRESFADETVQELVRLAVAYVRSTDATFEPSETLHFDLVAIYENLIRTNVRILARYADEVRIREAAAAFNRYHLAGMRALFAPPEDA